ncbi:MAG: hypothetical protein AAB838_04345 [Patescibacteria group bacterium]
MTSIVLFFIISYQQVLAIYDPLSVPNNKFGIHILEPAEVEKASRFANSSGGEWGYVTIPIRANDRDLEKWTKFMTRAKELKIIPILRIASFPVDDHWMAPNEYDLLDFTNFLDQLPWPIKNRYVIIYNEPNHESEWGGFVDPKEYSNILGRAVDLFHEKNAGFFTISAGLDSSQPNVYEYYRQINLTAVDGLSFHTYGNPAFATAPNIYSRVNVASFRFEEKYLGVTKPIFLTEAGWKKPADWFFPNAFTYAWNDDNIVAITPFLLDGGNGPFTDFSFIKPNGEFEIFAQTIMNMPKTAGRPLLAEVSIKSQESSLKITNFAQTINSYNILDELFKLLRRIFG